MPTFITCPPVVPVHLAADSNWSAEGDTPPRHNGEFYSAMLDTGADGIFIRPAVAEALKAPLEGNGLVHGIGETRSGIQYAAIQIVFPSANFTFFAPRAAVTDLAGIRIRYLGS
jgi:Aspartyl protease